MAHTDTKPAREPAPMPRIGPNSRPCPSCGWLMPQKPHEERCSRCARTPAAPGIRALDPLSTTEKLFLAAYLLRDVMAGEPVTDGVVHAPAWERVTMQALVDRARVVKGPPATIQTLPPVSSIDPLSAPALPLGTAPSVARAYLAACAAAWRARSCPL